MSYLTCFADLRDKEFYFNAPAKETCSVTSENFRKLMCSKRISAIANIYISIIGKDILEKDKVYFFVFVKRWSLCFLSFKEIFSLLLKDIIIYVTLLFSLFILIATICWAHETLKFNLKFMIYLNGFILIKSFVLVLFS